MHYFQGLELKGCHLFYACIASAHTIDHPVHPEHVFGINHSHHIRNPTHLLTATRNIVQVVLLAFPLNVALPEKRVDRLITSNLFQKLLLAPLYFLQSLVDVLESLELSVDIVLNFIQHLDRHDPQFLCLLCPQEVQLLDEHFFLLIVLFKLNAFLFQPLQHSLNPYQQLFAPLYLRVKLTIYQVPVVHDVCNVVHSQFVYDVVSVLAGNDELVVTHLP